MSNVSYDQQIVKVLTEAGERGISVQAIAKHVYNMNCTFFHQPDYQEIHACVRKFLLRHSKSKHPLVKSTGRRGYYRLNTQGSEKACQLLLQFRESNGKKEREVEEEEKEEKPQQDLSLSLFDTLV